MTLQPLVDFCFFETEQPPNPVVRELSRFYLKVKGAPLQIEILRKLFNGEEFFSQVTCSLLASLNFTPGLGDETVSIVIELLLDPLESVNRMLSLNSA